MKKYTQEEFEGFDIVDGFKLCPKGDYTEIKEFGNDCKFSNFCEFGGDCEFGHGCKFGKICEFGDQCEFGNVCKFGNDCKFSNFCEFGGDCEFGDHCKFGACRFDEYCKFGKSCQFSECCKIGNKCYYEDGLVVNGQFVCFKNIGSENREAYLYIDENKKLFLRAGCFFGDLKKFEEHCEVEKVANKTIKQYLFLFKIGEGFFEISD